MSLRAHYFKKVLHFNFDARTSRGRMRDKVSWIIKLWYSDNEGVFGFGECGPLPGLSVDDRPDFEEVMIKYLEKIESYGDTLDSLTQAIPSGFPSLKFAIETAYYDLKNGGNRIVFNNAFSSGKKIPINGLVWMGDLDLMLQQVSLNISQGYTCIKLKIGGLNFDKECDILHYIRSKYFRENIILRLDANGAFKPDEALLKLHELSRFNIHSIEQPVKPGLPIMEELCRQSPIPIALDEELIGVDAYTSKNELLERIKPQFIILKPGLVGGFTTCDEWIELAERLNIGWWITSALESNIGLNAICQYTAKYNTTLHQGLGTGTLYEDNFESPLMVSKGEIFYNTKRLWNLSELV